jgi:hypothetical protein
VKKINHRPLVVHAVVALALAALAVLLAAGCRPSASPEAAAAAAHDAVVCRRCTERNCASEAMACEADPARALSEDGARCMCLAGCRLQRHSVAACLVHCGPVDAPSLSLTSCWDAGCADRCPPTSSKDEP